MPSSDENAAFHFESVNARFDNLFNSPWLNFKVGKFELDNIVSEKRGLTLCGEWRRLPALSLHSRRRRQFLRPDRRQPVRSGVDGTLGQRSHPAVRRRLEFHRRKSWTFPRKQLLYRILCRQSGLRSGKLGTQRVGFYAMVGTGADQYCSLLAGYLAGGGFGNKTFSRVGFNGLFYLGKLDFQVVTQHGSDNAWFGTATQLAAARRLCRPAPAPPGTARSSRPTTCTARNLFSFSVRSGYECRSRRFRRTPSNLGNIDNYVFGYRYMPFMNSRAGFACTTSTPGSVNAVRAPDGTDLTSSSLMLGFDFDF